MIFTFVVLVIVVITKVLSNAGKGGSDILVPPQARPPGAGGDSEEERMRRFMEAVGLPPDATTPIQRVKPRTTAQQPLPQIQPPLRPGMPIGKLRRVPFPPNSPLVPRSAARTIPPAQATVWPSAQVQQQPVQAQQDQQPQELAPMPLDPAKPALLVPKLVPLDAQLKNTEEESAPGVPAIGGASKPRGPKAAAIPASTLLARLRNPTAVREAMILREVLGPPKALQASLLGVSGTLFPRTEN